MRPRKRIILLDLDEDRRGVLAYSLGLNLYHLLQFKHPTEAVDCEPDLIIATWPFEISPVQVLRRAMGCGLLVLCPTLERAPEDLVANHVLLKGSTTTENVLECVRVLSQRKRGPRKGSQYKQRQPFPAAGD